MSKRITREGTAQREGTVRRGDDMGEGIIWEETKQREGDGWGGNYIERGD